MATFQYFELEPAKQWQAGTVGAERVPFYFGCAGCDAKEPAIAGFIGTGPTFAEIGVIKAPDGFFVKPAMFCLSCWNARKATEGRA